MVRRDCCHNTVFFCYGKMAGQEKTFTENIFPCFSPYLGAPVDPPVNIFSSSARGEVWSSAKITADSSDCGQITCTP